VIFGYPRRFMMEVEALKEGYSDFEGNGPSQRLQAGISTVLKRGERGNLPMLKVVMFKRKQRKGRGRGKSCYLVKQKKCGDILCKHLLPAG